MPECELSAYSSKRWFRAVKRVEWGLLVFFKKRGTIPKFPSPLRIAWDSGRTAIWHNRVPAAILWLFGVALIGGYFYWPLMEYHLDWLGSFKTRFGVYFSILSTAVFGGMLPAIVPSLAGRRYPIVNTSNVISATVFWGLKGLEIDFFYRLQASVFGNNSEAWTVAVKTLFDQMVYVPLIGVVNIVLFYLWRDQGYSFRKTYKVLGKQWYSQRVLPLLISNWVVWIPAVALIYSLPLALQLPIQNLILCFWVLILAFFTQEIPENPNAEIILPSD